MLELSRVLQDARSRSSEMSDEQLAEAAKTDPAFFGLIFDRYVKLVYQYCRRRLWDVEAAEDATSIVFTKALSGIAKFRAGRGSFRSWLFAIAHHTVVDEIRARQRSDLQLHANHPFEFAAAGGRIEPESSLISDEGVAEIVSLLKRLPPDYARVIELRLAGLSDREIGQVLGRSQVAVRIVHHRALKRLSTLMDLSEKESRK